MRNQAAEKIEILDPPFSRNRMLDDLERLEAQLKGLTQRVTGEGATREVSAGLVRSILKARRERADHFNGHLFADPAWDILLELFALELEQRRVSVSKLCLSAAVPCTTALRWVEKLHEEGLISRGEDPFDGRRIWVSLSPAGAKAMRGYFDNRNADLLGI